MQWDSLLFKSLDSKLSLAVGMGLREQSFLLLNHHEIEQRLRHRGTESEEDVRKRLAQAGVELDDADTPGVHDVSSRRLTRSLSSGRRSRIVKR